MLYELRAYEALPGKLPALSHRFEKHTSRFLAKHGVQVVGFWTTLIGPTSNELTCLVRFESLADRERKWTAFEQDPEWLAILRETERDGPLLANIRSQLLTPTHYSPLP